MSVAWLIDETDAAAGFSLEKMIELSKRDARRTAVRAQLLTAERPGSLIDLVRGLTLLQIDATNSVAPNADLVVWSRVGSAYSHEELEVTLDQGLLLEVQGMIRPARRQRHAHQAPGQRSTKRPPPRHPGGHLTMPLDETQLNITRCNSCGRSGTVDEAGQT